ncbi:hypothetical protein CKO28_04985 [Rhodovibrio sodomensis]|uniref:Toprim domain-containing protein n=1 Tax=Rhodovibrio sodomensis TaxID=1088 RepID=A0ABS1DCR7_9PROT|nr:toprim domain-containing protein [Rhodovibrio sodomensis]MBK1667383.1 hypothetical protein [Rhodovibrio sodomensis]
MSLRHKHRPDRIPVSEIAERLRAACEDAAAEILREKPVKETSGELRFFPKGGLVVWRQGHKRGRWRNFGSDEGGDMLALYEWHYNATTAEAVEWAKGFLKIDEAKPLPPLPPRDREKEAKEAKEKEEKRLRAANFIWRTSRPAAGTPASAYLASRGITMDLPDSVGHRRINANGMEKMGIDPTRFPEGLDAAVFQSTAPDGQTQAVQQVLLYQGAKADLQDKKRTNGIMLGSAVKLAQPDSDLILAEGPETGLSTYQATGIATWILLGAQNFTRVEIPASVTRIVIAADIEASGNGLAMAVRAASYWRMQGYQAAIALPSDGIVDLDDGDFNDVLTRAGEGAVRRAIAMAHAPQRAHRDDAPWIVVRNPFDGFALWLATGFPVKATVKAIRRNQLAELEKAVVVGALDAEDDPLEDYDPVAGQALYHVDPSSLAVRDLLEIGGTDAVVRFLFAAAPFDREPLYGLEALALKPDAPVIVVQSRRALQAGRRLFPDAAVIAHKVGEVKAADYHWAPLKGRRVVIAPTNCRLGLQQGDEVAQLALAAGAGPVEIMDWPLYLKSASGYRALYRELPAGYDLAHALGDGWTGDTAGELLSLTQRVAPLQAAWAA